MGKPVGHIYYRAPNLQPLRLGHPSNPPALRWRGYQLRDGWPELQYSLDGLLVTESARPLPAGNGLEIRYSIEKLSEPLFYVTDPKGGATFTSSTGIWKDGVIEIPPTEARQFTITLTEKPGVEPLAYWSMNDVQFPSKKDPEPGFIGRAFTPGGTDAKPRVLDSGISYSALSGHATLMTWVKRVAASNIKSSSDRAPLFAVGALGLVEYPVDLDQNWHHIVLTLEGNNRTLYVDGAVQAASPLSETPQPQERISIGSAGEGTFFRGLLDEVRIYNRVLTPGEIRELYQRDFRSANL